MVWVGMNSLTSTNNHMKTTKFTVVLPPNVLAFYQAEAAREERSVSSVMCRVLRDAAGIARDPEEGSKPKTEKLPL